MTENEDGHDDDKALPVEDEHRIPPEKPHDTRHDDDDDAFPTAPEA